MNRSTKPYDPHCVECHEPIRRNSDNYRVMADYPPIVLGRTCAQHGQGRRSWLLEQIGRLA